MADNDAVALVAVGQAYGVAGDGNEFAVENRLGGELGFGEVHSIYSGYLKTKFLKRIGFSGSLYGNRLLGNVAAQFFGFGTGFGGNAFLFGQLSGSAAACLLRGGGAFG